MARRPRAFALGTVIPALALLFFGEGCSLLLDWNGYTGGAVDASVDDDVVEEVGNSVPESSAPDVDAGADGPEAAVVPDAGDDALGTADAADAGDGEAMVDAKPSCRAACGGCCDPSGTCLGGRSATTCGRGGVSCIDCTMTGEECDAGVCAAAPPPPKDGGMVTPTCSQTACMAQTICIPYYEAACCKADETCGCQALIPLGPCR